MGSCQGLKFLRVYPPSRFTLEHGLAYLIGCICCDWLKINGNEIWYWNCDFVLIYTFRNCEENPLIPLFRSLGTHKKD